jgi:hypothetical protein
LDFAARHKKFASLGKFRNASEQVDAAPAASPVRSCLSAVSKNCCCCVSVEMMGLRFFRRAKVQHSSQMNASRLFLLLLWSQAETSTLRAQS